MNYVTSSTIDFFLSYCENAISASYTFFTSLPKPAEYGCYSPSYTLLIRQLEGTISQFVSHLKWSSRDTGEFPFCNHTGRSGQSRSKELDTHCSGVGAAARTESVAIWQLQREAPASQSGDKSEAGQHMTWGLGGQV